MAKQPRGYATYFVAHTIHAKAQRCLTTSGTKKEGTYAISMAIILGNTFEYGLRLCHLVAFNNLGLTYVRICDNGRTRLSDHVHIYGDLGASFLRVAAHV